MPWSSTHCSVLLAALWLLAPVLPQLHYLVVQHSICDEHGELVEGQGATEDHAGHSHAEGELASLTASDAPSDSHEHGCAFLASQVSPTPSTTAQPDVSLTADHVQPLPLQSRFARTPPLDFAPKTSPPKA